jgi:uncharacterized membrane protein YeaQ/YmgE (transglycosylase-associated protein family)
VADAAPRHFAVHSATGGAFHEKAVCVARHSLSFDVRHTFGREVFMLGILGWILFGLVIGAIAKLLMPGRDPGGIIVTMLLGVAGALLGGFLGRLVGWYQPNEPAGYIVATLGAVLLLFIYRKTVKTA